MKNGKIIRLVFTAMAVLTIAGVAKAEELVDFDGNGKGNDITSIVNIKNANSEKLDAIKLPIPKIENKEKLNNNINYSIFWTINHWRMIDVNKEIVDNLKNLLEYGTNEEKRKFLISPVYTFPDENLRINTSRLESQQKIPSQNRGVNPVCMRWETKEVCVDKEKCDNVCDATTLVCISWVIKDPKVGPVCAAWGPACHLVCSIIKDCHQWPYCAEWYSDIY